MTLQANASVPSGQVPGTPQRPLAQPVAAALVVNGIADVHEVQVDAGFATGGEGDSDRRWLQDVYAVGHASCGISFAG